MKFIFHSRCLAVLLLMLTFGAVRAEAQATNGLGLSGFYTTNIFIVGTPVTTVVTVTNETGIVLADLSVTNNFSEAVLFSVITNSAEGISATNVFSTPDDENLVFQFENLTNDAVAQMVYTWTPQTAGLITNTITASSFEVTNIASITTVVPVYGFQADLGVSLAFKNQADLITNYWVITNDWLTYSLTVTNLGPDTATGILLTNTLPPGTIIKSASNSGYTTSSNNLIFSIGSLGSGAGAQYLFTIQPTNAGAFALTASLGAANGYDTNVVNNQALTTFFVTNYLPATLTQGTNSGQFVDQLNGLIEQTLMVTNTSGSTVPAVRVVVTGLTNRLYNASGTNNGNPFVVCPAPLAAGAHVSMRMQYNPRLPFPFTNGQLHAYALPSSVLAYTPFPPAQVIAKQNFDKIVRVPGDGDMLLEFTNLGGSYTVVYSDNIQFSNAMIATPAIQTGANRFEWLDYGPPGTMSAPTNSSQRFYRVYQNP